MNNNEVSLSNIWKLVLSDLSSRFSDTLMNLWFNKLELVFLDEVRAFLVTSSEGFIGLINTRYASQISECFENVLGFNVRVKVFPQTDFNLNSTLYEDEMAEKTQDMPEKIADVSSGTGDFYSSTESDISGDNTYTFENFIVGSSNRMAQAASIAVARNPADEYNPLLIYGASGLGKTHLMKAIAYEVKKRNPEFDIVFVKGDDFTNELVESIAKKTTAKFKEKYRHADMLLIDDVQFIAGKVSTQEEFFHTFNSLYEDHKQIVLTSDRPPREIQHLEERIQTRFEGGLIVDVQPPDTELRIAILKNKAERMHVKLSNEVLTYIAENVKSNVRQIEGVIKKLGALRFVSNSEITIDTAKVQLSGLIEETVPQSVLAERILEDISKRYEISSEDVKGKKRTKEIVSVRHIAIFIIREVTELSLASIGKLFGDRDHTTILSSIENIEAKKAEDSGFAYEINSLVKTYSK